MFNHINKPITFYNLPPSIWQMIDTRREKGSSCETMKSSIHFCTVQTSGNRQQIKTDALAGTSYSLNPSCTVCCPILGSLWKPLKNGSIRNGKVEKWLGNNSAGIALIWSISEKDYEQRTVGPLFSLCWQMVR